MPQHTQTSGETARKLVADAFAAEEQWLPACEAMSTEEGLLNPRRAEIIRSIGLILLALITSAALALLHTITVHAGYNWGYGLIEQICGQPEGEVQGIWSLTSLGIVVLPGAFGLAFGAHRAHQNGTGKGWLISPFVLAAIIPSGSIALVWSEPSLFDWFWAIALGAVSSCCLLAGLQIGKWVYSELKKRMKAPQMFLWTSLALLPFAIFNFVPGPSSLPVEVAVYFLSISVGAGIAAYVARSRNFSAAAIAGSFAMLPILLANFMNVASNVLSMAVDTLEWRALASAIAISSVTAAALCAGGALACFVRNTSRLVLRCFRQ